MDKNCHNNSYIHGGCTKGPGNVFVGSERETAFVGQVKRHLLGNNIDDTSIGFRVRAIPSTGWYDSRYKAKPTWLD